MIQHEIVIDVLRPKQNIIHVVQSDSARQIKMSLLRDSELYDVTDDVGTDALMLVEFHKADGHGGSYDTTSLGDDAVEAGASSNEWLVNLDGQCFTFPGWTVITVRFEGQDGRRISTFQILADVQASGAFGGSSEDYSYIASLDGLRTATEELQTEMAKAVKVTAQTWTNNQKARARANISAASGWTESAHVALYDGDIPTTEGETVTVQITDIVNFQTDPGVFPAVNCPVLGHNNVVGILTKPSSASNDYLITSTGETVDNTSVRVTQQSFTNNQKARARANISAASGWVENAHICLYNGEIPTVSGYELTVSITDIINFQTEQGVYPSIDSVVIGSNGGVGIITKPSAQSNNYLITSTGEQIRAQRPTAVLLYNGGNFFDPISATAGIVVTDVSSQTLLPETVAVVGDVLIDVSNGNIATVVSVDEQYFNFRSLGIHLGGNPT